ncbi:hypothetical protein [Actinacidiphila sp. ITFR-21]|uniref:hypothetical protein n=1 Tax=Actinacidiphila sp. ITFR-21 TaxID=3075199 RepID=UPI00288A2C1A|nr:hypothetical protein [Streptomyces sp. ITFR-21]WNI17577.1 hypothetical protein RLT57_20015 [Streptomyces sp. ITFR-21]WNI17717.1 hypothetical protein RLT57_20730 [Streptomyces sp. ITFR-21]
MPKATRTTDRRRTGRGDNVTGVTHGKSNLQDQRTKGAYAPKAPSTTSEFAAGVSVGRPMGAGIASGSSKKRAAPAVRKLGDG